MIAAFRAAAILAALVASEPGLAAGSFAVPRPPSVLSPDPPPAPAIVGRTSAKRAGFSFFRRMSPEFLPQVVSYSGGEKPGTIIIDTRRRFLFLVGDGGTARRYGVGVGRPGFAWSGTRTVTAKAEWPAWTPPEEMRARQPHLPVSMEGGPGNPLGARALYLGDTLYRIHGTTEPWTIGQAVSSGCFRMRNEDVIDLYGRVTVGTKVVVL